MFTRMTPADDRVLQLLQKWQKSLDLHARYADLVVIGQPDSGHIHSALG